jgi:hypothetical protein
MIDKPPSPTADEDHLRLLSIFHYVVGGLTALIGCFPIIHISIGLFLALAPEQWLDSKGEPPPRWFGILFAVIGIMMIAIFWTFAACLIAAGRCLSLRRHYMFCLVMAAIACMCQPWGTVLGVFTIIVLMRESVKQLFTSNAFERQASSEGASVV